MDCAPLQQLLCVVLCRSAVSCAATVLLIDNALRGVIIIVRVWCWFRHSAQLGGDVHTLCQHGGPVALPAGRELRADACQFTRDRLPPEHPVCWVSWRRCTRCAGTQRFEWSAVFIFFFELWWLACCFLYTRSPCGLSSFTLWPSSTSAPSKQMSTRVRCQRATRTLPCMLPWLPCCLRRIPMCRDVCP